MDAETLRIGKDKGWILVSKIVLGGGINYEIRWFCKTNVYKNAKCIEYIGVDGRELLYNEGNLMGFDVITYRIGSGGYLEIWLNTL